MSPQMPSSPGGEPAGTLLLTTDTLADETALASYLSRAGIDMEKYGADGAKSVAQLFQEVRAGESVLEWYESDRRLVRVVEPVFVQFRWRNSVLVETEQKLGDGRSRRRNMVLAEKRSPEDASVCATAFRGLREELGLPAGFPHLDRLCRFMPEHYCCARESLESRSYPGLPCMYVTHYCGVQLLESGARQFEELGLLADEFETAETGKTNIWRWLTVDEARAAGTKGLPAVCLGEGVDGAVFEGAGFDAPAGAGDAPREARRWALGALGGCARWLCVAA